jgi:hypothetical protein
MYRGFGDLRSEMFRGFGDLHARVDSGFELLHDVISEQTRREGRALWISTIERALRELSMWVEVTPACRMKVRSPAIIHAFDSDVDMEFD